MLKPEQIVRQTVTSPAFIFGLLGLYLVTALLSVPVHYRVRKRLGAAKLPALWICISSPVETYRMYRTYREAANVGRWPMWPYYLHVLVNVETFLFGFAVISAAFVR